MLDLKSNLSGEGYDFSNEVQLEFWPDLYPVKDLNYAAGSSQSKESKNPSQFIQSLNNQDLLNQTRIAAKTEQSLTLQVIELIAEINRRKLYLDSGYGSIFDFVTQDLGYEPSSAMRRIQAARAILEMPELKAKIADGSLSLSVISQTQSFLRKKANDQKQKISIAEKTELYKKLENKSVKEAEKEFFKLAPELCLKSKEQEKALSENLIELRFVIDSETKTKADELKLWLSHQNPDMTQAQFYKVMVEKLHRQLDPSRPRKLRRKSDQTKNKSVSVLQNKSEQDLQSHLEKAQENKSESDWKVKPTNAQIDYSQSIADSGNGNAAAADANRKIRSIPDNNLIPKPKSAKKSSRHIPAATKNFVWHRDQGCCQFRDLQTQKKCGSKFQVQLDHIHPFRHLGDHSAENLRLLCGKHNRRRD